MPQNVFTIILVAVRIGRSHARSNSGALGSNSTRGMDFSVRLFCIRVVLRVGSGLATG
jgi:hypothetical protein